MRFGQLDGQRVALWGWGREGRAAYRALRTARPALPLTLFCNAAEALDAAALHDAALLTRSDPTGEALSQFDVVIKSPGISPYGDAAMEAASYGTRFIGGTGLWFAEHADDGTMACTLCVTGTKGKSTTSSLLAHLLRAAGVRTALVGNIGLPLLEVADESADAWVVEVSSYQTGDVAMSGARPGIAIVTNIFPEHLDWHGGEQRYIDDKLALLTQANPRIAVLNAADPILSQLQLPDSDVRWYGNAGGWHLRGDALYRGDAFVIDTSTMPLPGAHNRGNLCAVLTALDAFGLDAASLASHATRFQPLPHRLQPLGTRDGIAYVNDSISTTPHATLAALQVYRDRPVAVIVGGHDRGLPWDEFAAHLADAPPRAIITMGANGPRIHALLREVASNLRINMHAAQSMTQAIDHARDALPAGGVVLLSPGAPSFGLYTDYVQRGRDFARIAGFDAEAISGIAGMGIA